ncbi:MAG TPA: methylated-DNA--[protein]-cysteine S-methyltransferase [Steroidobacteraceae bacterium]|jgi:AraC family transcriptional regulator of adaptative response/methylated-DNA-[protein]-cysteine methyltransferase|nr:methylated-DNA--[protein]-cysteine S-methyltransferase [Steroidobacteraceae bacterium]
MDMKVTPINEGLAGAMAEDLANGFVDSRDFTRMTRAIEFIERQFERQPRLAEIARHVGLSEFHFNRLFRRWTGLTPKQYLAEVTARAAGAALRDEPSVMDAAHAVGLSGGGRLHDLTVTLEAMTPGEIRAQGEGVLVRHGVANTPFGSAFLAETPRGLCRLAFIEGDERAELASLREQFARAKFVRDDARAAELVAMIWGRGGATLPLAVCGTNFQVQVWRALLELGPGATVTYSALARRLGKSNGARAVGNAVGANPVAWVIPCHRVLREGGKLGGYRWGTARKQMIRRWENRRAGVS